MQFQVIFKGQWSRLLHPQQYPSKPDENEYSNMIGASHAYEYTLWQPGDNAKPGLKLLVETTNVSLIEREIIDAVILPFLLLWYSIASKDLENQSIKSQTGPSRKSKPKHFSK